MTRSELLAKAAKRLGRDVPEHLLNYALRRGHVSRPTIGANGWADYSAAHVDELVRYVRTRSRRRSVARG